LRSQIRRAIDAEDTGKDASRPDRCYEPAGGPACFAIPRRLGCDHDFV